MIFLNNRKMGNVFQQNWYDFHNIAVIIVESPTKVFQTDNVCAAKQTPSRRLLFVQPNKRRLDDFCLYNVWHRNVWAAKQKSSGRPMFVQYLAPQCLCNQINAVWTDSVWPMFGRRKRTLK